MRDAVNHPEHGLTAGARGLHAVRAPRHVELRIDAFDEAETGESARADIERRVRRRRSEHTGLRVALGRELRVEHELIDVALRGGVRAAHRDAARDVGRVSLVFGGGVHHHDITGPDVAAIAHVVQLGAMDAATHDGAVGGPRAAQPHERVLERRLYLVLRRGLGHGHRGAMALGTDGGCLAQEGEFGGTLSGAQFIHHGVRVAHREARMTGGYRARELLAAGEAVLGREVRVGVVGQCVQRQAGRREGVHHMIDCGKRAGVHAHGADDRGGIGAPSIVERGARVHRRDEDGADSVTAAGHHDEGGVGLVEVREVVERR